MRPSLQSWINSADSLRHLGVFAIKQIPIQLAQFTNRTDDYYLALVGELFGIINAADANDSDWAQLGNAFLQFSAESTAEQLLRSGISREDATLFGATCFYFGKYPASASLAMRYGTRPQDNESLHAACFDFLARPNELRSRIAIEVRNSVLTGNIQELDQQIAEADEYEKLALRIGPEEWVVAKLLSRLLRDFYHSNIRAVLPDGQSASWTPLVESLINRRPSTWEFFPSQIQAIHGGLLSSHESYSLQMPTGAGKTTLCETLLYWHLTSNQGDAAVMLVPYRSLASELRGTLVRRLNALGIASRCAYGGTVPTGDEIHELSELRLVVATPEALLGLLGADPSFASRVGLVICDEGHLLDGDGRGIGLELLLARFRARADRTARIVFMSAIVPNIEQINGWLGGTDQTVVRSTYRPALAEFAVLRSHGTGAGRSIDLEMHPHESDERRFSIERFLERHDFGYRNPDTGREKTYEFSSIKAQAIAAARKALPMGAAAIFAVNKRGNQGAIGIAESLIDQLRYGLQLPKPVDYAHQDAIARASAYLEVEYGADWIGSRCALAGVAIHHGDIPQEAREVLERLIRAGDVKLIICTATLAEGVNLPIRTLILYSLQRRDGDGNVKNMLARDIKNLVGRAGRAGANTKGLVICANSDQWQFLKPVATQGAGEPVRGSLLVLIERIRQALAIKNVELTNEILEGSTPIHPLVDGVDSALVELLSDEIGEEQFVELALNLATHTFAAQQLSEQSSAVLQLVFTLRARRVIGLRASGKATWARETGANIRLVDSVSERLRPLRKDWGSDTEPLAEDLQAALFQWAWSHAELLRAVKESFRLQDGEDVDVTKDRFFQVVTLWMTGASFREISSNVGLPIDDLLAVFSRGVSFSLQTLIEQGVSLLEKILESEGLQLADGVKRFPERLRYGSPTQEATVLAASGLRHRRAYIRLGAAIQHSALSGSGPELRHLAGELLTEDAEHWRALLGELIYQDTLLDLLPSA